jgi:N-acetylglucosamine kinase-like BadF-type ATPase
MILIADSGSTKTTWMEITSGSKTVTEGLNPHFCIDERFLAACQKVAVDIQQSPENLQIHFYGAGCGTLLQKERVEHLLSACFHTDDIHVETDMLGACRAVSGKKASIVAILGTGSNACYYDGEKILWQPRSTGYVMGDSGSSNHVGRKLLNDYLTERMPETTRMRFHECFPMTDDQFIDAVYHKPYPNRFLASLAPFAVRESEDDYCRGVIDEVLDDWHRCMLTTIMHHSGKQNGEVNLVGGFAKAIEQRIRQFLENKGQPVGTIVADPIEGIALYHRETNTVS